jgi:acyl-coenzyme A synthetase/AMP-(fatty) acid ligase/acyl carrier protein
VVISRSAFALHCAEVRSHYELAREDRILQFASSNFDAALEQIFPPLASGATVVLRESDVWDARELQRHVMERGLTIVNLPPAYWHMWVQELRSSGAQVPEGLRLVIVGGDVLPGEGLRAWREIAPPRVRLLNAYGPTETTITATTHEVVAGDRPGGSRTPIGRPIGSRLAYILDRWGDPVPVGVPGELHLGGTGVARGYLGRPEITAERFIPDPFGGKPGARLYRTGDLARYREDGAIEFLGRADGQVKIRGFRIELGEIEHILAEHPAVKEAVVLAREDSRGDKRVAAYVTIQPQSQTSPNELESYLKDKLPEFMLPSTITLLETFPLTPGGKVDRRALPAPEPGSLTSAGRYEAPRDPVEEKIAAIWKEILGVDQVGVHDDFFRLGGHSLLATQAAAKVRDAFALEITLRDLFQAPTVAGLAVAITDRMLRQADEQELAQLVSEIEGRGKQ